MRRYVLLLWLVVLILTAAFLTPLMGALSAAVTEAFTGGTCVSSMLVTPETTIQNPVTCQP